MFPSATINTVHSYCRWSYVQLYQDFIGQKCRKAANQLDCVLLSFDIGDELCLHGSVISLSHRICRHLSSHFFAALIAVRIWKVNRLSAHIIDNSDLKSVMLVILESGAIYSCMLLAMLICHFCGLNWVSYLLLDAVRRFHHF
jgi:hypothetical protein